MKTLATIITILTLTITANAQESKWLPVAVQLDKFSSMMSNDTQRKKIIDMGTNAFPVVGETIPIYDDPEAESPNVIGYTNTARAVVEAYLWSILDNPNTWTETATGKTWVLIMSNGAGNMCGHKFAEHVNDANWLGQLRSEMKALNPIKGGYWVWRGNPDPDRQSIKTLLESEGLVQDQPEEHL
jgi:hypothetical protein